MQDGLSVSASQFVSKVQNVLHISQLKRYCTVSSHVLDPEPLELNTTLSYVEQSIHILDTKFRSTRRKDITVVKVLWANHEREAATWETKTSMREKYPHLFKVSKVKRT